MSLIDEPRVQQLAPDARAFTAAKKIARPAKWQAYARDKTILWGTAIGSSGSYQVYVDVPAGDLRCSCPSRKRPCKHALALLLLEAGGTVPEAPVPAGHAESAETYYETSWE